MWLLSRGGQERLAIDKSTRLWPVLWRVYVCLRKGLMSHAQATVLVIPSAGVHACAGYAGVHACAGAVLVSLYATPLQDACTAQDGSAAVNLRAGSK